MAIDFSQALLAFAGGAAEQYNKNVAEERKEEREARQLKAKELSQKRIRQFQASLDKTAADEQQTRITKEAIRSEGVAKTAAKTAFDRQVELENKKHKLAIQEAKRRLQDKVEVEREYTKLVDQDKSRSLVMKAQAAWDRNRGNKPAQILAMADVYGKREQVLTAARKGLPIDARFTTRPELPDPVLPKVDVQDKGRMSTDMSDPAAPIAVRMAKQEVNRNAAIVEGQSEIEEQDQASTLNDGVAELKSLLGPSPTKIIETRIVDGQAVLVEEDELGNRTSRAITVQDFKNGDVDKTKVSFQEIKNKDGSSDVVLVTYQLEPGKEAKVIGQQSIGESARQQKGTRRWRQTVVQEVRAASDVLQITDRMQDYVDSQQRGIGGVALSAYGFFTDMVESITGAPDANETTLRYWMTRSADPEQRDKLNAWMKERMDRGASGVLETMLKYKVALMDKPSGKISVDDMTRVDNMLGEGIRGGRGYAGAINQLVDMARSVGERRIAEAIRNDDSVNNFTGRVKYDIVSDQWIYETISPDGEKNYRPYNI